VKLGRPESYSDQLADEICHRLSGGESLRSICADPRIPSQQTVYSWLIKKPAFLEKYTRAREAQAETMADEIVAIADETPITTPVYNKDGEQIDIKLDSAYVQWQRQRIDARKWTASKLRPKKYGDRTLVAGDAENPLQVGINETVFGEILKNLKMSRQVE
jgi:hypothetical protein